MFTQKIFSRLKELFPALISAVLLIFSFSSFNLSFLAWFALLPLFFASREKSPNSAFLIFYFAGLVFFLGTIYWLSFVTFFGTLALAIYLALYFGLFGFLAVFFNLRRSPLGIIFIASLWVILEYLRANFLTGFGWALLGYSQYRNLLAIQIADFTGSYGVSFLVIVVNLSIAQLALDFFKTRRILLKNYILPIIIILFSFAYGAYKLNAAGINPNQSLKVSVIQANIPQKIKWEERAKKYIISKYFHLTQQALSEKPDLIIWPEAALPFIFEEQGADQQEISRFVKATAVPMLIGVARISQDTYYNSAVLFSRQGEVLEIYDKLHLVPFGEYVPFQKIFSFLDSVVPIGDFHAGKDYTIFKIKNPFAVLICFEDVFPALSRQFIKKGAEFLVNITNDAWFGESSSAFQHLQASIFRAVENRTFIVRAANTGISGFIDAQGKIISLVSGKNNEKIFIDGYQTQRVFPRRVLSLYTRFGDIFVLFNFLLVLYGIIINKINGFTTKKQRS